MIWSRRRRIMGNLVPAIPLLVLIVAYAITRDARVGLIGGPVAILLSWLALNRWGFWDNAELRHDLVAHLMAKGERISLDTPLVGFADPESPSSALDAHGDVGFLFLGPEGLRLRSETREIQLPWRSVRRVTFGRNPHSWVFLGRWIVIEATRAGKPYTLRHEPRIHATMRQNRRASRKLAESLVKRAVGARTVDSGA